MIIFHRNFSQYDIGASIDRKMELKDVHQVISRIVLAKGEDKGYNYRFGDVEKLGNGEWLFTVEDGGILTVFE